MAAIHCLLTILLIQSIHTAEYYVASDGDEGVNNFYEYALSKGTTSKTTKMSFPLNICTKNGNHLDNSEYSRWNCNSGGIYGPCKYGGDTNGDPTCTNGGSTCTAALSGFKGFGPVSADLSNPGPHGETCPDGTSTTTTNYVQINYYCGYTSTQSPPECPNNNVAFSDKGFVKLATDVCVDQEDGNYFKVTCNNETAEIGIYSETTCTNRAGTHASYTRGCQLYAWPNGNDADADTQCRLFRRVSACIVNGVDILANTTQPTSAPTFNPTTNPTTDPTNNPSINPTAAPSATTSNPTISPTNQPTQEPTMEPTIDPTIKPSDAPTGSPPTKSPTLVPTEDLSPDATLPDSQAVLSTLDSVSIIYIVFAVLFVFYIFICLYIWCNERRKRETLTRNFQKGADKEQRIAYLREKNRKRKLELMAANGAHPQNNNNYRQMDIHVEQNSPKPLDQQLMSEGR